MIVDLITSKAGSFIIGVVGAAVGAIASALGIAYKRGKKDSHIQDSVNQVKTQSLKNEQSINDLKGEMSGVQKTVTRLDERSIGMNDGIARLQDSVDDVKKIMMNNANNS